MPSRSSRYILFLAVALTNLGALRAEAVDPMCGVGIVVFSDAAPPSKPQTWGDTLVVDHLIIKRLTPGGPALKGGLELDDQIIQVNDINVSGKKFKDAVQMIRGEAGTPLKITVIRSGAPGAVSVTLTRVALPSDSISKADWSRQ